MERSTPQLTPENITFCLQTVWGPLVVDEQSDSPLAMELADLGFETRWLFMDSIETPHVEKWRNGLLMLHRWFSQTNKEQSGGGAIQKCSAQLVKTFNAFAPKFIMDFSVRPSIANGRIPVIIGQGWQTADALLQLHQNLVAENLRQQSVLMWLINHSDGDFTSQSSLIEAANTVLVRNPASRFTIVRLVKAAVRMAMMVPELKLADPRETSMSPPGGPRPL